MSNRVRSFLDDAHRNGHHGPAMLKRWAMLRNQERRAPHVRITVDVLEAAIEIEEQEAAR